MKAQSSVKAESDSTTSGNSNKQNGNGKPPRPVGSLDRRRQLSTNREERDHKSRSAHSLKEKVTDAKDMKGKSKTMICRTASFEVRAGGGNGSISGESALGTRPNNEFHRASPGFWEPPPPPSFPYYWDGYHFWPSSSCHASREELRSGGNGGSEYNLMAPQSQPHRRGTPLAPDHHHHHHPGPQPYNPQQQRYGSNNTLSTSQQDLSYSPYYGRYMGPPAPPPGHGYCGCEGGGRPYHPHHHHSNSSLWNNNQVGEEGRRSVFLCK